MNAIRPLCSNRQDQLLEELDWSCFRVFAEVGFSAATLERLAAEAELSRAVFSLVMGSKLQAFERALRVLACDELALIEAIVEKARTPHQAVEHLHQYLDRHQEYLSARDRFWREAGQRKDLSSSLISLLRIRYWRILNRLRHVALGADLFAHLTLPLGEVEVRSSSLQEDSPD